MYTRICPDWRKQHEGKALVLYEGEEYPGQEVVKIGICEECLEAVLREVKIWSSSGKYKRNVYVNRTTEGG